MAVGEDSVAPIETEEDLVAYLAGLQSGLVDASLDAQGFVPSPLESYEARHARELAGLQRMLEDSRVTVQEGLSVLVAEAPEAASQTVARMQALTNLAPGETPQDPPEALSDALIHAAGDLTATCNRLIEETRYAEAKSASIALCVLLPHRPHPDVMAGIAIAHIAGHPATED